MSSFNKVIIMGNLTRDPDLKYLSSGTAVCEISLALNDNYKSSDGETVERTVFVDVIAWGKRAEVCEEHLQKGSSILVEGTLQLDQWETNEGEKRSKLRVRSSSVTFVGAPPSGKKSSKKAEKPVEDDDTPPF